MNWDDIERINEAEREWRRDRKKHAKRQERLVWLITFVIFAFLALALWCGPASAWWQA